MADLSARTVRMTIRAKMLSGLLLGAAAGLGQAPWGFWAVTLLALAALAVLLDGVQGLREAALVGWAAGVGHFGLVLSWLVEPFLVDAARHGWMAPFAMAGMAGGLALFWALAFWAARWLGGARWSPLALVVTLSAAEMLRAYVLTGFPWGMIAYVWSETPPMQIVRLTGPHGLTVLTLLATAGAYGFTAIGRGAALTASGAVWAGFVALSFAFRPETPGPAPADAPLLRLVQPNAPQHQKWDPEMIPVFFRRQLSFTSAPGDPDLVIWPETSVPALLERADGALRAISEAAGGVPVVAGIQRRGVSGFHNSLVVIGPGGAPAQVYDKHHLVPFGEYVPLGDLAARFGVAAFAAQEGYGYAKGPGPRLLEMGEALGRALPLICYEAIFPQDVNGVVSRPRWLLQITNDAWFGEYSGPYQHFAQARFRAVEQGLPLVRAANTGISAVIDARGRDIGRLPLGEAGFLDLPLPPARAPTLYSRSGDIPMLLLLIVCAAAALALRFRNSD